MAGELLVVAPVSLMTIWWNKACARIRLLNIGLKNRAGTLAKRAGNVRKVSD